MGAQIEFHPFFGASSVFSNWHPTTFYVHGEKFNCSEQYYMWMKALFFGDHNTAANIMRASSPREQKRFGRTVKNFNRQQWYRVCKRVMRMALYHKFTQNTRLRERLLATKGYYVEASRWDKYWGVGLSVRHPNIRCKEKWRGRNELGNLLNELRQAFKEHKLDHFMAHATVDQEMEVDDNGTVSEWKLTATSKVRSYKKQNSYLWFIYYPFSSSCCSVKMEFPPDRFKALVSRIVSIDSALADSSDYECHIGGNVYVSVKEDVIFLDQRSYNCSRRKLEAGCSLQISKFEWRATCRNALISIEQENASVGESLLHYQREDHMNQLGSITCSECNPQWDYTCHSDGNETGDEEQPMTLD